MDLKAGPPCPSSRLCISWSDCLRPCTVPLSEVSPSPLSPAIIITSISPCLGSLSSFSALLSISQNHLTHYPLKICHISPGSFYPCDEGPMVTSLRKPKLDLVMALPSSCQPDLRSDPSRHPALCLPPNQCLMVESGSARGRRAWRFPSFTGAQWSCFRQARHSSFPVSS